MTVDRLRFQETPIVRDMRQTARAIGIVNLLLDILDEPMPNERTCDLLIEALQRLGVSGEEMLTRYNDSFKKRMPK